MGFGPFSSSSDTRTRVSNVNSSVNQAEGAYAFTPRIARDANAAVTQSGIAVQGQGNAVSVVTSDFGAIGVAGELLNRTLQSQANLSLEAVGFARELAETKVSDGANITSKTSRIALYALAAIVIVFLIFRR
jgi:hypothetical protein